MKKVAVLLQAAWLPVLVCALLASSALYLVPRQLHSECEMTWMFSWPQYQKLNLSLALRRSFPQYSLHLYRETRRKVEPDLDSTPLQLLGLPVLFIPGNAGSHKQARSSASIALQMHRHEFPHLRHFDFFTVNLNEEFSGLFGGVLHRQTLFVAESIKHILSLYPNSPPSSRPNSVLIIAHSMGGVVAQALFTLPNFPSSLVPTIITLSSPLSRPVVAFDHTLLDYYHSIAEVWYGRNGMGVANNVTLVSVSGGDSDVQVPPHVTIPPSHPHSSHHHHTPCIASSAVPRNWVAADHQAIVWLVDLFLPLHRHYIIFFPRCRRLQLAISRALFLLQTPPTNHLTSDPYEQQSVLRHILFRGWKIPIHPFHTQLNSELWRVVESTPFYQESTPPFITALPLPPSPSSPSLSLLVATNSDTVHWIYACHASAGVNCTDLSPLAGLLPPREKVVKYISLSVADLEGATHIVIVMEKVSSTDDSRKPRKGRRPSVRAEEREFLLVEWCEVEETRAAQLPLWGTVHLHLSPSSHCTLTNITLPHLTHIWTAHSATITSSCAGVKGGLLLPWLPHTPFLHDNGTGHLIIPLSLQVPVPDGAIANLLVWTPVNCSLSLSLSPSFLPLAGKLFVMYTPLLLPWVTAVAISKGQLLGEMVLLAVIWGTTSKGFPPGTDWEQLTREGLWTAWGPLLVHLVARGLFQIFRGVLDLMTQFLHHCLPGRLRWALTVAMTLLWLPGTLLCSSVGLLCVLGACTLKVRSGHGRHLQGLLVCLSLLSLPSLCSWVKDMRYSLQLSVDPLWHPVGVASALSIVLLLLPSRFLHVQSSGGCGFTLPLPLSLGVPHFLISLSLLLYATIHTYRLAYFTTAAILHTLVIVIVPQIKLNPCIF